MLPGFEGVDRFALLFDVGVELFQVLGFGRLGLGRVVIIVLGELSRLLGWPELGLRANSCLDCVRLVGVGGEASFGFEHVALPVANWLASAANA